MHPRLVLLITGAIVGSAICLGLVATAGLSSLAQMWTETVADAEPGCERDRERLAAQLDRYRHQCRGCVEGQE